MGAMDKTEKQNLRTNSSKNLLVDLEKASRKDSKEPLQTNVPNKRSEFNYLSKWSISVVIILVVALCGWTMMHHSTSATKRSQYDYDYVHSLHTIAVNGSHFIDGDKRFFVSGFNIDNIVEAPITLGEKGKEMVNNLIQRLASLDVTVIRTWAHTVNPDHPLQDRPGIYNETAFEALDYVIATAGRYGIRLTLSFTDSWRYRGGVMEYLDWSQTAEKRPKKFKAIISEGDFDYSKMSKEREQYEKHRRTLFYKDEDSKRMFKDHITAILNRKNKFSGVLYREDPAIFSFDLHNEPRCDIDVDQACNYLVQSWLEEMVAHFRKIDPKHLLTIGQEGMFGEGNPSNVYNPGGSPVEGGWAHQNGQEFVRNHAIDGISYATIHAWPDNWNIRDESGAFMEEWIDSHEKDARHLLKMPLVVEEFGKYVPPSRATPKVLQQQRDPIIQRVLKQVQRACSSESSALQGSLVWELAFKVYKDAIPSGYGISLRSESMNLVAQHAKSLKSLAAA